MYSPALLKQTSSNIESSSISSPSIDSRVTTFELTDAVSPIFRFVLPSPPCCRARFLPPRKNLTVSPIPRNIRVVQLSFSCILICG